MSKDCLPEGAKCDWCEYDLDDEERESPRLNGSDEPICDDCYQEEYEFPCCLCENYDEQDVQHEMLVVFVPTSASGGDKVQPGVYAITGGPYWGTDYFSSWLDASQLAWLCPLPESLRDDDPFYPVGHLCRDCQKEMQVRGVQELTKKCAMAFC